MANRRGIGTTTAFLGLMALGTQPSIAFAEAPQSPATLAASPLQFALQKARTAEVDMTVTPLFPMEKKTVYAATLQEHFHLVMDTDHNRLRAEKISGQEMSRDDAVPSVLVVDGSRLHEFDGRSKTYFESDAQPITQGEWSSLYNSGMSRALGWTSDTFVTAPDETLDGISRLKVFVHTESRHAYRKGQPRRVVYAKSLGRSPDEPSGSHVVFAAIFGRCAV